LPGLAGNFCIERNKTHVQHVAIQGDPLVAEILVNKRFGNNSIYSDRFVPEKYNGRAGFVPLWDFCNYQKNNGATLF